MHFHKDHALSHRSASEITPRAVYEQRRTLLKAFALGAGGTALAAWRSLLENIILFAVAIILQRRSTASIRST